MKTYRVPHPPLVFTLILHAAALIQGASNPRCAAAESIAAYGAGEADIVLDGRRAHVTWSEPRIVAVATKPEPWGHFQFPKIARGKDDALFVQWNMQADSITSYGQDNAGWRLSHDLGRTWQPTTRVDAERFFAMTLPNGDRLAVHTPEPRKTDTFRLPSPVGTAVKTSGKVTRQFYRVEDLPADLQGVYLKRLRPGESTMQIEHAMLDDPGALRYAMRGLVPVVWWGDIRVDGDGSLVAGMYPGYYLRHDGTAATQMAVSFYRSIDLGRSWKIVGKIPYTPDLAADPPGAKRGGFTEPAFEILGDGTYLCVLRSTDGIGIGPMYATGSRDRGATWTKPEAFARNGVLPQLLRLKNGALLLASGRPGVQVRFAADHERSAWTPPLELVGYAKDTDSVSCGYTGLVALGEDRVALVYSVFRHRTPTGEVRKAIALREITVTLTHADRAR